MKTSIIAIAVLSAVSTVAQATSNSSSESGAYDSRALCLEEREVQNGTRAHGKRNGVFHSRRTEQRFFRAEDGGACPAGTRTFRESRGESQVARNDPRRHGDSNPDGS
jgi:hypothetical protein